MLHGKLAIALAGCFFFAVLSPSKAQDPRMDAALDGYQWLVDRQGPTGGWNRFGGGQLSAALIAYSVAGREATPPAIAIRDLILSLQSETGSWNEQVGVTANAAWALLLSGHPAAAPEMQATVSWLRQKQDPDGSWQLNTRNTSDALIALVAAGVNKADPAIQQGVLWLKSTQNSDGYWGATPGSSSTASGNRGRPILALSVADSPTSPEVQAAVNWAWSNNPFQADWRGQMLQAFVDAEANSAWIQSTIDWLVADQNPDGSWTYVRPPFADFATVNTLSGLAAAGGPNAVIDAGFAWVDARVAADGSYSDNTAFCRDAGWPLLALTALDANAPESTLALNAWRDSQGSQGQWDNTCFYGPSGGDNMNDTARIAWTMARHPQAATYSGAINSATSFLVTHQNADGGWGVFGNGRAASEAFYTSQSLLALLRAGYSAGSAPVADGLAWLIANRTGLAWNGDTPLALMALDMAGAFESQQQVAVSWLLSEQNADGGWGTSLNGTSTVQDTAWTLIALERVGAGETARLRGAQWLTAAQRPDGGWSNILGPGISDTDSSALATWALSLPYNDPNPVITTLETDLASYNVDQAITFTATTSEPDAVVTLSIVDPTGWSRSFEMTADGLGSYTYQLPLDRYYRPGTYSCAVEAQLEDGRQGFANDSFDVQLQSTLPGDANGDFCVDLSDLAVLLANFGFGC